MFSVPNFLLAIPRSLFHFHHRSKEAGYLDDQAQYPSHAIAQAVSTKPFSSERRTIVRFSSAQGSSPADLSDIKKPKHVRAVH